MSFQAMTGATDGARSASLVRHLPLGPAPGREIHVPGRYADRIGALSERAKLSRTLRCAEGPDARGSCELSVLEEARRGVLRIEVARCGARPADVVGDWLFERASDPPVATQIDLSLGDPATPGAVERLRALGFFYGGWLPELRDGDVLRLQRLATSPTAASVPVLESDAGRQIRDYVLGDAARREPE